MIFRLHPDYPELFPDPELADSSGLLAVGGDLSSERLIAAYRQGIFPWSDAPILWYSPDPRCVLLPERFHIPRSLRRRLNKPDLFRITFNQAFESVIRHCAAMPRPGQDGTWIGPGMIEAYCLLNRIGIAHSVEAWENETLVAGLYGVALGKCFCGESMFHIRPYAAKIALVVLLRTLWEHGFLLFDCQMSTPHMLGYGAQEISRSAFLALLREAVAAPHPFPARPSANRIVLFSAQV